jgi:hypothetical protein
MNAEGGSRSGECNVLQLQISLSWDPRFGCLSAGKREPALQPGAPLRRAETGLQPYGESTLVPDCRGEQNNNTQGATDSIRASAQIDA